MTRRLTCVHLPGLSDDIAAWVEWGENPADEMIEKIRARARVAKLAAEAVLAAPDEDFCVRSYDGVFVQRKSKIIQKGRKVVVKPLDLGNL